MCRGSEASVPGEAAPRAQGSPWSLPGTLSTGLQCLVGVGGARGTPLPCPVGPSGLDFPQLTGHGCRERSSSLQSWPDRPQTPATVRNRRSRESEALRASPSVTSLKGHLVHSHPRLRPWVSCWRRKAAGEGVGGTAPPPPGWEPGASSRGQRPGPSLAVWQLRGPRHPLTCQPPLLPPRMRLEPAPPPQQDSSQTRQMPLHPG